MNRSLRNIILLCVVAFLSGCAGASKKANEIADQTLYKPIVYENANKPGPTVVVFPGAFKSRSALFIGKYGENNIRDFTEIELSNANFTVIERADTQPLYDEIVLAANLGDAEALSAFKKQSLTAADYFIVFDLLKAEPVAWSAKGGSGELAGALIQLGFLIANKGKSSALGDALGTTVASLKHYEYDTTWDVAMKYKVVDANTGCIICANEIKEQQHVASELSSALGVTQGVAANFTIDALIQRLIQEGVYDIDKNHKEAMLTPADQPKKKKRSKKIKTLQNAYEKKLEEASRQKDEEAALDIIRAWYFSFSNLDAPSVMKLSSPKIHAQIEKNLMPIFKIQDNPNWRDRLTIDISQCSYEMLEYAPDKCTVVVKGPIRFGKKGKEKTVEENEPISLEKEDGQWKVASLKVDEAKD